MVQMPLGKVGSNFYYEITVLRETFLSAITPLYDTVDRDSALTLLILLTLSKSCISVL